MPPPQSHEINYYAEWIYAIEQYSHLYKIGVSSTTLSMLTFDWPPKNFLSAIKLSTTYAIEKDATTAPTMYLADIAAQTANKYKQT